MTPNQQPEPNSFEKVGTIITLGIEVVAYVHCGANVAHEIAQYDCVKSVRKMKDNYRVQFDFEPEDNGAIYARDYFTEHVKNIAAWLQAQQEN